MYPWKENVVKAAAAAEMEEPGHRSAASSSPHRRLLRCSAFCRTEEETVSAVLRTDLPPTSDLCLFRRRQNFGNGLVVRVTYINQNRSGTEEEDNSEATRTENVSLPSYSSLPQQHPSILARIGALSAEYWKDNDDDDVVFIDPLLAINLGCYEEMLLLQSLFENAPCSSSTMRMVLHVQSLSTSPGLSLPEVTAVARVRLQLVGQRRVPDRFGIASELSLDLPPPALPARGTLLQASTLIRVVAKPTDDDKASGVFEFFYIVQIPREKEENDDDRPTADDFVVTTAETHFTVHRVMEGGGRPWLPPPQGCTQKMIPHPNASDLRREFLCTPPHSAAQCIWHLIGTNYDHDGEHLVRSVAEQLGRTCLAVSGLGAAAFVYATHEDPAVTTGGWVDKLRGLQRVLHVAAASAPALLLLSDLEQEFTQSETRPVDESRLWNLLTEALVMPNAPPLCLPSHLGAIAPVIVVLMTREALPVGPIQENLWHPSIALTLPDAAYIEYLWTTREKQFLSLMFDGDMDNCSRRSIPMSAVQQQMQGRCVGEILELRNEWWFSTASALDKADDGTACLEALCQQRDDARRHVSGRIAPVHWSDVGGLEHVRREILDAIELPWQYPALFGKGHRANGILLYGPPGTGKTLVAKAVATECSVPFVSVKGPELLGSYVGESEAQVRSTFAQARNWARQNQPPACILFFDELDSIAPRRGDHAGSGGGAVMDRVVATLFAEMDRGNHGDEVLVFCMGATNRPDMLDPALLRPGRFDRLVYLGVSSSDYHGILVTHLRKIRLEEESETMAELLIPHLPTHLTGADLSTIATGALIRATERLCADADRELVVQRQQRSREGKSDVDITLDDILSSWEDDRLDPVVTLKDLLEVAQSVVPSVSAAELENYERIHQKYQQERRSLPFEQVLPSDSESPL